MVLLMAYYCGPEGVLSGRTKSTDLPSMTQASAEGEAGEVLPLGCEEVWRLEVLSVDRQDTRATSRMDIGFYRGIMLRSLLRPR